MEVLLLNNNIKLFQLLKVNYIYSKYNDIHNTYYELLDSSKRIFYLNLYLT